MCGFNKEFVFVCLHSEFEIAATQLTGRFRKFGTIADNTSFLSI